MQKMFTRNNVSIITAGILSVCALVIASSALAFTAPTFVDEVVISPTETHGVTLATDTDDNIYALLSDGAQIQKFDSNLNQLPYTGSGNGGGFGSGLDQFGHGTGIDVYRGGPGNVNSLDDRIYVGDRLNNRIKVLDVSGNLLFQFGSGGESKGQFHGTITAVDVDEVTGDVYVLDALGSHDRVQKFNNLGVFLRMWGWGVKTGAAQFEICTASDPICYPGQSGSGVGQFNLLNSEGGVATDGTHVFISDGGNFQIDKFDTDGNYVASWGSAGSGDGQFSAINSVTGIYHQDGLLYTTEGHPNQRLQVFNTDGVFEGKWGNSTVFYQPGDVVLNAAGEIFVGDFYSFGRISKWTAAVDPDADNDGVPDNADNCPTVANPDQVDQDLDNIGNECDPDLDGDGSPNGGDNCPDIANPDQADLDQDGIGDVCDGDGDGDSVADALDNCPTVANTDQANNDGDAQGDACDGDDDNDAVDDGADNCPLTANTDQADSDGDGQGNACDGDVDGDGVGNEDDLCPLSPSNQPVNDDGCTGAQHIELTCMRTSFPNHGQYVSCVAHTANEAVQEGLITPQEKARIVSEAAKNK